MKGKGVLIALLIIGVFVIAYSLGLKKGQNNGTNELTSPIKVADRRTVPAQNKDVQKFLVGQRNIKAMLLDGDTLWIGTSGGIVRYNTTTNEKVIFDNKRGLLSNGILSLKKIDGKIWVGTYGGGLSIFDGTYWQSINVPNGLADAFVYDVEKMKDGSLWIATWSGANRITGDINDLNSWEMYTKENTRKGIQNDWVYGLARDPSDDTIWMGTEGGLVHFNGKVWTTWNHNDGQGAPYDMVKAAIEYKEDPSKVSKHHAQQKKDMGLENVSISYNPNYIIGMDIDFEGRVWVGTWGGGVSVMENGEFVKTYTTHDGLPGNHIFMVKVDPKGNVWLGTSKGLTKFDGKQFKNYDKRDGLVSNQVFSIAFDERDDSVWVGSFGGVAHLPKLM